MTVFCYCSDMTRVLQKEVNGYTVSIRDSEIINDRKCRKSYLQYPLGLGSEIWPITVQISREPRREKTNVLVSDTNRTIQPQKIARGLKFRI